MSFKQHLIEVATRTKNCHVCGDEGHLCDDCRESFLNVLEEEKSELGSQDHAGELTTAEEQVQEWLDENSPGQHLIGSLHVVFSDGATRGRYVTAVEPRSNLVVGHSSKTNWPSLYPDLESIAKEEADVK